MLPPPCPDDGVHSETDDRAGSPPPGAWGAQCACQTTYSRSHRPLLLAGAAAVGARPAGPHSADPPAPPPSRVHPGFRFFEADNYRDVFLPGDTDAGAFALADALGWGEELRALIARERAAFDATLAAAAAAAAPPSAAVVGATDGVAALAAALAGSSVGGEPAQRSAASRSVADHLAGAAAASGAAALAHEGHGVAVDARGLGVLADALRDLGEA